jgi:translation initiation factor 2 subunit 2
VDDLGFGKKKKKKKAKDGEEGGGEGDGAPGAADGATGEGDELGELKLKKKKKKKATPGEEDLGGEGDGDEGAGGEGDDSGPGAGLPWANSTRDYHYEELLGRVFGILRQHNPELAGEKHKTILKPPQVLREGTKKTVFVNFSELCKAMHRAPDHVIAYLLAELGTSGSLDGQARLIVKGRFLPKVFEGILRRYINDYVICNMCKSADTLLHKENRLYILRCQAVSCCAVCLCPGRGRWHVCTFSFATLPLTRIACVAFLPPRSAAHRAPCPPSSRASWLALAAARLRRERRCAACSCKGLALTRLCRVVL